MKSAVIVVDMHKDAFNGPADHPTIKDFRSIVPRIRDLVAESRSLGGLIVYAQDSYLANDFLFTGRMKPHAVRGTIGEQLIDDLDVQTGDIVLPKRRFSAFFRTDLDMTLRVYGIDTIAVCGLVTEVCVLATALDGLCNDFSTVIISDCCTSRRREDHEAAISIYSHFPTYPTLRVRTAEAFINEVRANRVLD
nr:cysteine hydrolase [Deltaproteobacteria bacterium]